MRMDVDGIAEHAFFTKNRIPNSLSPDSMNLPPSMDYL